MTQQLDSFKSDLVELVPLPRDSGTQLVEEFQSPGAYRQLWYQSIDELKENLASDLSSSTSTWFLWKMLDATNTHVGYAGFIRSDGPERVFYFFTQEPWDHDTGLEAVRLLVPWCMEHGLKPFEEGLLCFIEEHRADEIADRLEEMGFDRFYGYKYDDAAGLSCFAIDRDAYAAYYSDEEDELPDY